MKLRSLVFVTVVAFTATVQAQLTTYNDQGDWLAAVDPAPVTTLTFTEFSVGTRIYSQYAPEDMTIDYHVDFTDYAGISTGGHDGQGLGVPYGTTLHFATPITAFGILFPGQAAFQAYYQGNLVGDYQSYGGIGDGFYLGVTSPSPIDRIDLIDPTHVYGIFIDDMQYVQAVPEPAPCVVLGLGALGLLCRRKKTC